MLEAHTKSSVNPLLGVICCFIPLKDVGQKKGHSLADLASDTGTRTLKCSWFEVRRQQAGWKMQEQCSLLNYFVIN